MNSNFTAPMPFAAHLRVPESSAFALFPRSKQTHISEIVCDRLEIGIGSRVLDIGCGNGANALEVARRTGAQVIGVDEQPDAVREAIQARHALDDFQPNTQFFAERPEQLPFADRAFDAVYCDRFQDTANDVDVLADSMVNWVKEDGSIVLTALYQRRESVDCEKELCEWLGDSHGATLLGDVLSLFESRGMVLDHFESLDEYLGAYIESMIWNSLLDPDVVRDGGWGAKLSRSSACNLLKSVDNRDIGYAALVLKREA